MEGRFLPIGSVVRLKEGKKRLMITGFLPIEQNEKGEKMYGIIAHVYIQKE